MFRALALPIKAERSRTKERLEASLAGLCELELLKQRQECLVLGALCLGDSSAKKGTTAGTGGCTAWGELCFVGDRGDSSVPPGTTTGSSGCTTAAWGGGELLLRTTVGRCASDAQSGGGGASAADDNGLMIRRQPSSLQCTPWGLLASVEQQVSELRVKAETKPVESPAEPVDGHLASEDCVSRRDGAPETLPHPLSATFRFPEVLAEAAGDAKAGETSPWDANSAANGKAKPGESTESTEPTEEDYQQAQRIEVYISGLIHRRVVPQRPCKPRTSLAHDTRASNVTRQSSLCRKDPDQHAPGVQVSGQAMPELLHAAPQGSEAPLPPQGCHSLDQERYLGAGFPEEPPGPYHHHVQHHQPGLYPRPRQASMASAQCSPPLDYPSCRVLQDSSNSEPDSPQHFHLYPSPPPHPLPYTPPSSEEQLVNAEYIPAQPCRASTRSSAHPHSSSLRGSGAPKPSPGRSTYSPERGTAHHHHHDQQPPAQAAQVQHSSRSRGGPKKCRASEDRGGGGGARKPGKKACRSQSENSLQRVPERKYNTVERDGGGSGSGGGGGNTRGSQPRGKKPPQGSGSYRRWRSTLELSQDEADQPPAQAQPPSASAPAQRDHGARRTRKSRAAPPTYAYPHGNHHHHPHYHQHIEYQLERDPVPLCQPDDGYAHLGQGESESSLSEADSPDSSSLSSDSDESGGLVWPQQLPPQLSLPAPPSQQAAGAPLQPKAFVKIKASHALKKKILRFRTGSLKVMTTV